MTALMSINCATGEMGVYVRRLRGGVKRNAHVQFTPDEWATYQKQFGPDSIEDFRRLNSKPDYIPLNPDGPNTPGAPMAMRAVAA